MQRTALAVLIAMVAGATAGTSEVSPVQKVIQMMEGMMEKGTEEKQKEEVQFAEYKSFCETTVADKIKAIDKANEAIELLKADIEKYTADAEKLADEITAHDKDLAAWKGDVNAAKKVRAIENKDFMATTKDYTESIDALGGAIAVLKKQTANTKQASFVQLSAVSQLSRVPPATKKAINLFLMQAPEGLDVSAPEASGYEFQSGGIVEMLEKLLDKFSAERKALQDEEGASRKAYEMMIQDLENMISRAQGDRDEAAGAKAKALQNKADSEGNFVDTTTTRDADVQYMTDTKATCETKATDFESRQKLRAEELVAVQKAIDIVSSGAVSGASEKHAATALLSSNTALAQLRTESQGAAQARAATFLRFQAERCNSRILSALAMRMESDPFKKIKKMIKDLMTKLMEEATEEAEHKGWCDTELGTNTQTREEKTTSVEQLTAEIDELKASISHLTEDLAELTAAVAELDKAVAEATKIREEEKAKNADTIADAEAAQTAVEQALVVLKEFYAKAAEATALVQQEQQPEAPEVFDKPYQGMGGGSGGVVAMLEVINSDFARLESDTIASETAAASEYKTFMQDSEIDKAEKSKDIEHKTAKKKEQSSSLVETKANLEGTQKELDAAIAYYDKLKPTCIDSGVTYEDTVARRKEEIESLQQALKILNGEELA